MSIPTFSDLDLAGKRVLIRQDLNVPIKAGRVTSDARIRAALPTLTEALARGAKVLVMSHLGRPKEGLALTHQPEVSLAPVAEVLSAQLGRSVPLISDYLDGLTEMSSDIVLLENVRINVGEKANDPKLAAQLAQLCDVFVMDAFGTAHRGQASTAGVVEFAPAVCAGPLLGRSYRLYRKRLKRRRRRWWRLSGGAKSRPSWKCLRR